jgi:hypothetical protein
LVSSEVSSEVSVALPTLTVALWPALLAVADWLCGCVSRRYFFLFDHYLLVTKREGKKKYWLKVLIKLRPSIKVVFVKK